MTKPMITIHNAATGEIIEREMTSEELAQLAIDQTNLQAQKQAEAQTETAKAAATAKLAALGLTADDLKALGLGGN
jgi:hypothetical protein